MRFCNEVVQTKTLNRAKAVFFQILVSSSLHHLHNFRSFTTAYTHKNHVIDFFCDQGTHLSPSIAEFSHAMDVRAMHPFWIEIFYLFFCVRVFSRGCLNFLSVFVGERENLKGDFFSCICAHKREEKARRRSKRERKETERWTIHFPSRTFVSTEFGAIPGRARSRGGGFLAGGFARGFFLFFFSLLSCSQRG